jgi:16S rRNA (cytidine1402-2'-O)-methyltransferase
MSGTLYLIATPIGNLEDITLRALRILREVDLIACEDTRHTRKMLSHFNISKPTVSYHEHNERERTNELIAKLEEGTSIALVSDAGTPLLSDPGFQLTSQAIAQGISVIPVPGASALVTAIAASGLPVNEFSFAGFLPPKKAARRARLIELANYQGTLIFYEAPHRIKETLSDTLEILGNRQTVIAREMTKLHEEFLRGRLSEVITATQHRTLKGEIVLLIGPKGDDNQRRPVIDSTGTIGETESHSILAEVERLVREEGLDNKGALKRVARAQGISKSEAYRRMLAEKSEE